MAFFMINFWRLVLVSTITFLAWGCSKDDPGLPKTDPIKPTPGTDIVLLPIVVHVIHFGEEIGSGPNLADELVQRQIEILNEDFRRIEGSRGYNDHPDGADTKIEFVLATRDPGSKPFSGINRIDASQIEVENMGHNPNHYAQYAYWNPAQYINVWTTPLAVETRCLVLGSASGPRTDLPGTELLSLPGESDAEGILINWMHFGESDIDCHARYGRTLTHELGHYLGLLHTWAGNDCEHNDFCDDTPAVDAPVFGRNAYPGCDGDLVMIGNYMNFSDDEVMNIFTRDQVARMHYVLLHHSGRNSLMTSPALP